MNTKTILILSSTFYFGTAGDLPKDEDFYQFQYLRVSEDASQNVLGASIPFQLRKPKNEELCAVQVHIFSMSFYSFGTYISLII